MCVGIMVEWINFLVSDLLAFSHPLPSNLYYRQPNMPNSEFSRVQLACLTALQIWDTELGPSSEEEVISSDVAVPREISDILADITQAVRACVTAFRNPGKSGSSKPGRRAN